MADDAAMFQPYELDAGLLPATTPDERYELARRVVAHFGVFLPEKRPTVEQVQRWRAACDVEREELAEYIAAVGAIRLLLEVNPAMDEALDAERTMAVVRGLLAEAPDTPHGDRSSVELLVRLLQQGRLKAQVTVLQSTTAVSR